MIRLLAVVVAALALVSAAIGGQPATYRIDHVKDGDTVVLRNSQRVRLVQIDTPEVYFGTECLCEAAGTNLRTRRTAAAGDRRVRSAT